MTSEIEIDFDIETADAPAPAREPRVPNAVWINRPAAAERGAVRAGSVLLGALAVAAVAAFGALVLHGEASVSAVAPARAGAAVEITGNGPTGYFPDSFGRVTGEIEPPPPTF
jgi:hypothetical protein